MKRWQKTVWVAPSPFQAIAVVPEHAAPLTLTLKRGDTTLVTCVVPKDLGQPPGEVALIAAIRLDVEAP